MNNVPGFVAKC